MCRMLAFKAKDSIEIKPFFKALTTMASSGINAPHGDGFGFTFSNNHGIETYRDSRAIWETNSDDKKAKLGIFHARKASPGYQVNLHHVHPFTGFVNGKSYAFAHNGTIYSMQNGRNIDSQEYFKIIMKRIETETPEAALYKSAMEISKNNRYSSITAFLTDYENLWALKFCTEEHESSHNLFLGRGDGFTMLSSESQENFSGLKTDSVEIKNGEIIVL